jgi:nucleotide-binding universal stress UspA family protein
MYCKCPVVLVHPNYRFHAESKIYVLPLDRSLDTRQKVPFTCKLAKLTNSEIHILVLHKSKMDSSIDKQHVYAKQVQEYITAEGVKSTIVCKDAKNLTKAVLTYAESVDADLVSIMTEQESSAMSFLLGTYAEQMLAAATMPVLTVSPRKLLKTSLS